MHLLTECAAEGIYCLRFATAEANQRPEAWRDTLRTSTGRTSDAKGFCKKDSSRIWQIEAGKLALSMPESFKRESFEFLERVLDLLGAL